MNEEKLILKALTSDLAYTQRVTPFIKKDYFSTKPSQAVYLITDGYFKKHGACPTPEVLNIEVEKLVGINQDIYDETKTLINEIINTENIKAEQSWLISQTEEFVKERALYNALNTAIQVSNGNEKKITKTAIPQILADALAIDFDMNLGYDYIRDAEAQADYYNSDIVRVPTGVEWLDDITNGGFPRKTLNSFVMETHTGKSMLLSHIAASSYLRGSNVLYITLEESKERIHQRIDSDILNIHMDELQGINKTQYLKQINSLKDRVKSRLIVKEYPTSSSGALAFKTLLTELKLKENFEPDLICIDYLGICVADSVPAGANTNTVIKRITEELRALSFYANAAIVSAQQTNREGADNSEPSAKNISESFGSLFVCDFVLIAAAPQDLRRKNMLLFLQYKNRHRDIKYKPKFVVGVDSGHMRVYSIDSPEFQHFNDIDLPIMDATPVGKRLKEKSSKFGDLT